MALVLIMTPIVIVIILMAVSTVSYPRILAIILKIMSRNYRKCIINTAVYQHRLAIHKIVISKLNSSSLYEYITVLGNQSPLSIIITILVIIVMLVIMVMDSNTNRSKMAIIIILMAMSKQQNKENNQSSMSYQWTINKIMAITTRRKTRKSKRYQV